MPLPSATASEMAALPALTRDAELQAWKIAVERSRLGSGSFARPREVDIIKKSLMPKNAEEEDWIVCV